MSWLKEVAPLAAAAFVLSALATDALLRIEHRRAKAQRYAEKTRQCALLVNNADERLKWSATRIAKALRDGDFTSVEITTAFINHFDKINLYMNAMIASRGQRAIREAREADEKLERYRSSGGTVEPFLGVPIFSKEVFEMPGMPFSAGVKALAKRYGTNTCYALGKVIREGGVIVLGAGNISEQCMWMESENKVYGRTNNVYNCARTVGGSSGGTAASISALATPFGITSDIGGSTRIPSLYNGLFGVKPTGASVSNLYTTPQTIDRTNWFCQLGPCARHSEDLLPLLKLLAGAPPTGLEKTEYLTRPDAVKRWVSDEVSIKNMKVYDCRRQPGSFGPLSLFQKRREAAMINAHDRVVACLKRDAKLVKEVDFPALSEGFDIWGAMLGRATAARPFRQILAEGKSGGSLLWAFKELFVWFLSWGHLSDHTLPAVSLAALEFFEGLSTARMNALCARGDRLKADISALLGDDGVMIVPSLPTAAPEHGNHFLIRASESGATGLINVLEFPACAIPLGLDANGVPVGVQVIANHGNDHLCISVARALEKAGVAGWVPPRIPV